MCVCVRLCVCAYACVCVRVSVCENERMFCQVLLLGVSCTSCAELPESCLPNAPGFVSSSASTAFRVWLNSNRFVASQVASQVCRKPDIIFEISDMRALSGA